VFLTEGYEKPKAENLDSTDNDMLNGDPFLYKLGIHERYVSDKAGRPIAKGGFWDYDTIAKGDVPVKFDQSAMHALKFLLSANTRLFR